MSKSTTFKPRHMEELRRLGMGGYPCATFAAREMIAEMRERFAPDVDMPKLRGDA